MLYCTSRRRHVPTFRRKILALALAFFAEDRRIRFSILNFRRVLNVVCFLVGNSPASVFYMPTDSVPKRRHIKFRRRGITQKKANNKGSGFSETLILFLDCIFPRPKRQ